MKLALNSYLQIIKEQLRLDPASENEVIRELEAHVEDSCQEMQNAGLPEREALEKCLKLLGPARIVARQIYETHNQGTWRQALLAAMPHLFFAIMFALKWLMGITWLPIMFAVILGIGLYGWCHGKPTWLFPWLSYALFPVVAAGISLLYLPAAWSWVTLALYIPIALWLFSFITIKFMRRDWLYSTLMLLPASAFVGWFLATGQNVKFPSLEIEFLYGFAPWTGLTFLVLAISVALFIRLRQRWLRIAALIASGVVTAMVTILASSRLGLASFIALVVLIFSFLLVPAFVERKVKQKPHSVISEENHQVV
ncbi:MAG: hypothetical protein PHY28_04055 [Dehalococcoidales bacterium]|nr:hypothetical protein [Dehalococcoidales bacterium]